jgi:hypothetical protein
MRVATIGISAILCTVAMLIAFFQVWDLQSLIVAGVEGKKDFETIEHPQMDILKRVLDMPAHVLILLAVVPGALAAVGVLRSVLR